MSDHTLYLRADVAIEPLLYSWYAWPLLIPPATGAMYLVHRHCTIMESYLADPQLHQEVCRDALLRGGPFIHYEPARAPEIRELLDATRRDYPQLFELARAMGTLEKMLVEEARGSSLEPLYAKIPAALRGFVELTYDLRNGAWGRLIEEALYRSPYYDVRAQSIRLTHVSDATSRRRSFAFNAPRLIECGDLLSRRPFSDSAVNVLYRARSTPQRLSEVADALALSDAQVPLLRTFFSDTAPRAPERYDGDGVRIRFFGHACVLVETRDASLIIDPLIRHGDGDLGGGFTHADLPASIDCVLISHAHNDHCIFEPLVELRHRTKRVVVPRSTACTLEDPSLRGILRRVGFKEVVELGKLETLEGEFSVTAIPFFGEHGDLHIRTKSAWLVRANGRSILFMVDSNNVEPKMYEQLQSMLGPIDVLFIGLECDGAMVSADYGPLFPKPLARAMDQGRRLNGSDSAKAIDIVRRFAPKRVLVYAMASEPWVGHILNVHYTAESRPIVEAEKFVASCRGLGIAAERLHGQRELLLEQR